MFEVCRIIHPPKQTWNLKMDPWKRRFLLETIISRFHVNFWGCRWVNFYTFLPTQIAWPFRGSRFSLMKPHLTNAREEPAKNSSAYIQLTQTSYQANYQVLWLTGSKMSSTKVWETWVAMYTIHHNYHVDACFANLYTNMKCCFHIHIWSIISKISRDNWVYP